MNVESITRSDCSWARLRAVGDQGGLPDTVRRMLGAVDESRRGRPSSGSSRMCARSGCSTGPPRPCPRISCRRWARTGSRPLGSRPRWTCWWRSPTGSPRWSRGSRAMRASPAGPVPGAAGGGRRGGEGATAVRGLRPALHGVGRGRGPTAIRRRTSWAKLQGPPERCDQKRYGSPRRLDRAVATRRRMHPRVRTQW